MKFVAMIWVGGELQQRILSGPPTFHAWRRCWRVFRMAMILLRGSRAGALDAYEETIRALTEKFPGKVAWGIIARADDVMRSEFWECTRRQIDKERKRGVYHYRYSKEMPWEAVIRDSANNRDYWTDNVRDIVGAVNGSGPPTQPSSAAEAALTFNAEVAPSGPGPSAGVEAAARASGAGAFSGGQDGGGKPPKRPKATIPKVKKQYKHISKGRKDGRHTVDETGKEICFLWSRSASGCVNGACPNGRARKCEFCLDTEHRTIARPSHPGWKPGVPK